MKSKLDKKKNRKAWIVFLLALILVYAAGTGASFFFLKEKFAFDSSFITDIEARQKSADAREEEGYTDRLYSDYDQEFDDESAVLRKDTLLVVAEDIIRRYMEPYKVKLRDLYMDKEGILYIDFSDEFKVGFNVDITEELKMLSGLYTSIQSSIPGFKALKILIDGREAESMGGHIDISRPIGEDIASTL